jgi:hypothetical protein
MLVHDNLAFHNVAELVPAPGGGLHLSRFPRSTWTPLDSASGDLTIRISNGSEIRFVTTARRIRLYLRALHNVAETVHLLGRACPAFADFKNVSGSPNRIQGEPSLVCEK